MQTMSENPQAKKISSIQNAITTIHSVLRPSRVSSTGAVSGINQLSIKICKDFHSHFLARAHLDKHSQASRPSRRRNGWFYHIANRDLCRNPYPSSGSLCRNALVKWKKKGKKVADSLRRLLTSMNQTTKRLLPSLNAVITSLNPLSTPHESVTYCSVTWLVRVKSVPSFSRVSWQLIVWWLALTCAPS